MSIVGGCVERLSAVRLVGWLVERGVWRHVVDREWGGASDRAIFSAFVPKPRTIVAVYNTSV